MDRRFLAALILGMFLLLPGDGAEAAAASVERVPQGSSRISRADRTRVAQAGEVTPDKIERWRRMPPAERERIRKRYRRWRELPPVQRERILERRRAWRSLPEAERGYLRGRREIYRQARPEEKRAIGKFVRRMRQLPPEQRQSLRRNIGELRHLPAPDRDERLMDWPFYRRMSPAERGAVNRFLFSEPRGHSPGGSREPPHE